jgi:transcriptional regulator with XRE-family HTH domain
LRDEKHLSQGDIQKRTGLLRCYISRVENGHTVPAVETIEKFARALEVPIYQLFYDGEEPPGATAIRTRVSKNRMNMGLPANNLASWLSFGSALLKWINETEPCYLLWRARCQCDS